MMAFLRIISSIHFFHLIKAPGNIDQSVQSGHQLQVTQVHLRIVQKRLCNPKMLRIPEVDLLDSRFLDFIQPCPGHAHQDRRMGGNNKLGVVAF